MHGHHLTSSSFLLREAVAALDSRVYDQLLEIAIADPEKRARNREVWSGLKAFYNELRAPMENPENVPEQEEKADLVQALVVIFVGALTACFGEMMATLYCHHFLTHNPARVRRLPMNLSNLSQQGFEALMKQGKNNGALGNKRLRDDHCDVGRNQQMLQTEREQKRIKRDQPMPKSRNEKRQLKGTAEMHREATARVDSAVRRGVLPSRSKAETDKRISKQKGALATILKDFQLEEGRDTKSPLNEEAPPAQEGPFAPHFESGLQAPLSAAATASSGNTRPREVDTLLADTGSGRGMSSVSGETAAASAPSGGRAAATAAAAAGGRGAASAAGRGGAGRGAAAAAAASVAGRGAPSRGRGGGIRERRGRRGGVPASARML
jgi:hypothetical protein